MRLRQAEALLQCAKELRKGPVDFDMLLVDADNWLRLEQEPEDFYYGVYIAEVETKESDKPDEHIYAAYVRPGPDDYRLTVDVFYQKNYDEEIPIFHLEYGIHSDVTVEEPVFDRTIGRTIRRLIVEATKKHLASVCEA